MHSNKPQKPVGVLILRIPSPTPSSQIIETNHPFNKTESAPFEAIITTHHMEPSAVTFWQPIHQCSFRNSKPRKPFHDTTTSPEQADITNLALTTRCPFSAEQIENIIILCSKTNSPLWIIPMHPQQPSPSLHQTIYMVWLPYLYNALTS